MALWPSDCAQEYVEQRFRNCYKRHIHDIDTHCLHSVNSISVLFFPVLWDLPSGTKLMLIPGPVNYSIITPAVAFLIIDDCLQWVLVVLAQIPMRVPETHLEDPQGQNEIHNTKTLFAFALLFSHQFPVLFARGCWIMCRLKQAEHRRRYETPAVFS